MPTSHTDSLKSLIVSKKRILIYLASGIASVIIDYGLFLVSYYVMHQSLAVAVPTGLTAGLVASFVLNKLFTFSDQVSRGLRNTLLQILLYLVLFAINNIFTVLAIKSLLAVGAPAAVGKAVATVIVTLWNYLLYKTVIFK